MTWRSRMARLTGQNPVPSRGPRTPLDNIDKIDKKAVPGNFVNFVNFFPRPHKANQHPGDPQPPSPPDQRREPVPLLTPSQCREIGGWSVAVQQEFARQLEAQEALGWPLAQAEALAYHQTRRSLEQGLVDEQAQPDPLPPLPDHLEPEARRMAARLEAAGWRGGLELAHAILLERHGLVVVH